MTIIDNLKKSALDARMLRKVKTDEDDHHIMLEFANNDGRSVRRPLQQRKTTSPTSERFPRGRKSEALQGLNPRPQMLGGYAGRAGCRAPREMQRTRS